MVWSREEGCTLVDADGREYEGWNSRDVLATKRAPDCSAASPVAAAAAAATAALVVPT